MGNDTENTSSLKSCPFCGGDAELKYTSWWDTEEPPEKHDVWSIGCAKRPTREDCCLGRLCTSRGFRDRDKAIEAWNNRWKSQNDYEDGYADGFDRGQEAVVQQIDAIVSDNTTSDNEIVDKMADWIADFWVEAMA